MVVAMSDRLDKDDWVLAGLKTLRRDGIDAVRVERLATQLKVTKGSFYWHLKDRKALLSAMLATWKREATQAIIDEVEHRGGDALARLRALFEIVLVSDGKLELAIRAWASTDKATANAVKSIDLKRIGYLETLYQELGFSKFEANVRARLGYQAVLGQYAMAHSQPTDAEFNAVLAVLTHKPK